MEVDTSFGNVNDYWGISEINDELIKAKTKKDSKGKAIAAIKILRSFIISNNYESAESFVSSVKTLPENATNNDWARWYYYLGLIEAMKGISVNNYKTAKKYFEIALRKAPTNGAIGFKQEVNKWLVLVMLLIGEIPERNLFRVKEFEKVLLPYMRLTKVVKLGDVEGYNKVKEEFGSLFTEHKTMTLVGRIHKSVIRTAIRQIATTYSRIFISDMAVKLQSPSVEDAHDTVMKVFKEGLLRGMVVTNDPEFKQPYVKFGEAADHYRGTEPQTEFDKRINELLDLHSHAVKALRYPDSCSSEVETIAEQRKLKMSEWIEYKNQLLKAYFFSSGGVANKDSYFYKEFVSFLSRFETKLANVPSKKIIKSFKIDEDIPCNSCGVPQTAYNKFLTTNIFIAENVADKLALRNLPSLVIKQFEFIISLFYKFKNSKNFKKLKKLKSGQINLPICQSKDELLEKLENNQILLIAGDTGCGKSTQVNLFFYF
ncbi:PCI domain-containing protein [Meloidogyne graminicola]|uniref:PCI domain-containing protein n=1 Tax=Meloidogyne graminicola TaxID=189291 RepID=A0A8S9ZUI1_9BILA|nr:PCI domain-containing protein [Meloidogyne graminicola]